MNALQILIHKHGFSIYNGVQQQNLVSNIKSMEDALEIFHELSRSMTSPKHLNNADWQVIPGALAAEG